jgi:hypothetical protein
MSAGSVHRGCRIKAIAALELFVKEFISISTTEFCWTRREDSFQAKAKPTNATENAQQRSS